MSDSSSMVDIQAVVSALESRQSYIRAEYSALALFTYEFAVTFAAEVQHIWMAKKSLVFYLFVALRYSTLLYWTFIALSDFVPITSPKGCGAIILSGYTFEFVMKACSSGNTSPSFYLAFNAFPNNSVVSGVFVLRAYAMWNRNAYVLLGLTLLTIGKLTIDIWNDFFISPYVVTGVSRQYTTCSATVSQFFVQRNATNSALVVVFDTCVLLLTVAKTAQQVWTCRKLNMSPGVSYFVFRDGLMYFLSIELWVIATIATTYLPVPAWTEGLIGTIEQSITIVLTQRLVLNLRQVDHELRSPSFPPSVNLGQLSFAHGPALGNIGAPLRDTNDDGLNLEQEEVQLGQEITAGEEGNGNALEGALDVDDLAIDEVERDV